MKIVIIFHIYVLLYDSMMFLFLSPLLLYLFQYFSIAGIILCFGVGVSVDSPCRKGLNVSDIEGRCGMRKDADGLHWRMSIGGGGKRVMGLAAGQLCNKWITITVPLFAEANCNYIITRVIEHRT